MKPSPTLKWPGGKWTIAGAIVGHFPPHDTYCSLFFGGGADLFAKPPAPVEIVNDLDDEVINYFRVLREQPDELRRVVALTPWSRREWELAKRVNDEALTPLERARRFLVALNMSHGSRPGPSGWRHDGPNKQTSVTLQWAAMPERISVAAERLRSVMIECRPALDLLARYNGPDVLAFADPPYLGEVRRGRRIYRHEMMKPLEHRELLDALRGHVGPAAITHYRCSLYDDTLRDWTVVELGTVAEHGQLRVEGLYLNPVLVTRLRASRQQPSLFDRPEAVA